MKKSILCLITLLLIGCNSTAINPPKEVESTKIVLVTDLHYLSPSLSDYGEYFTDLILRSDGKITHYTPYIIQAFVEDMLNLQPDVVVLSGDLTLNGSEVEHRELAQLLRPLLNAGIQVNIIPGNHDIDGDAYRFDEEGAHKIPAVTTKEFIDIYQDFGYNQAKDMDIKTNSYIREVNDKLWLLMIDVNSNGGSGIILDDTVEWTDSILSETPSAGIQVISISHQNLYIHNDMFQWGYQIIGGNSLLNVLEEKDVLLHLSGHLHLQNIVEDKVTEIATSSLAITPHQYGIIDVYGENIEYTTESVNVSKYASKHGLEQEDLLHFDNYSKEYFEEVSRFKLTETVDSLSIDNQDKEKMLNFAIEFNTAYFTGTLKQKTEYQEGLDLWNNNLGDEGFNKYFQSIPESSFMDQNSWSYTP